MERRNVITSALVNFSGKQIFGDDFSKLADNSESVSEGVECLHFETHVANERDCYLGRDD